MTHESRSSLAEPDEALREGTVKHRDPDQTRQRLLSSAKRRFALDGYAATKVRDIAADAAVNVALINRYFQSKEGLFEACLTRAVQTIDRPAETKLSFEEMIGTLVDQIAAPLSGEQPLELLLLLRSSGDEDADRIRRHTVEDYTKRLAMIVGWKPDDASTDQILLRAQVALSAAFGIVILRSSTGLEPMTSASEEDLGAPLTEIITCLLAP